MFQNCDAYRLHRIDKYYENFQMDDTLKVVLLEDCNSSVLLGKGNYWLQEAGKGHDFWFNQGKRFNKLRNTYR